MLTVDDYGRIRRAHRDGMSIREMAQRFHHSRHTIRKILNDDQTEPGKYPRRGRQPAPKLGLFHDRILEILKLDEKAPPKQRHTAMRIFERLRDEEGYVGQYDAVRRFVKKHRESKRETFIPLDHAAGQRVEADFGEISVDFPDGRRKVNVLILVWSYSNAPFAIALPTQRTEAILEGMSQAFEFFGCVPKEVWWDNPKTVATAILKGRERTINERYAALASHFAFDPLYCMPRSGNEKPVVENRVKTLERNWSTPVPQVKDIDELNTYLRQRCVAERDRVSSRQTDTIGVRFEEEKFRAAALPNHSFDACIRWDAKVDKYQFARFDNVNYSVPRQCAFLSVTVKAYVDRVDIVHLNVIVATHIRCYSHRDQVLNPLHYLATLERRPAALDHSNVYRNWTLPPVFYCSESVWKNVTALEPECVITFACCSCWRRIRLLECSRPSNNCAARKALTPIESFVAWNGLRHVRRVRHAIYRKHIWRIPFTTKEFHQTCCRSRFRCRAWIISMSFSVRQHKEAMTMRPKNKVNSKTNSPQPASDATLSKPVEAKPSPPPKINDANQMLVKSNLRQLRLPTMKAEFDKLAREAAESNQTYQDYLLRLTELEVAARSSNALNSRIKQASFPVQKDLDTYDFSALPSVNKQKVLELSRCEWISARRNVCLLGQPGTGKTHLAVSLGLAACRHGLRTTFFTAATLVNQLEEAQKQFALDRMLKRLDKHDLLIVDELGYLSFSRSGAELLFQVFADRYERRSLLITSNLAFSDWGQIFQGERMTAALLDRLTHHSEIFEMNGESFRFKESMKQKQQPGSKD